MSEKDTYLLLACSKTKRRTALPVPAYNLYLGALFVNGWRYAEVKSWPVKILSAKYGLIDPYDLVLPYNEVMTVPWKGPWPAYSGFYLGGFNYFSKAPSHFQPLVPVSGIGEMVSSVQLLLKDMGVSTFSEGSRGVVQAIYDILTKETLTKEQLYRRLCYEFGESPKMVKTINAQLTQNRMGRERDCLIIRSGSYYRIQLKN